MSDILAGKWNEIKGKVRAAWGKLTDDDVEQVKGNWDDLSGRIQKTYGYDKKRTSEEIENFKKSLS